MYSQNLCYLNTGETQVYAGQLYFAGIFNKIIILLTLVGIIANDLCPLYHLISNMHSWMNCY